MTTAIALETSKGELSFALKISCGKRHFETLGVDYAAVTSLAEVAMCNGGISLP